MEVELKLRIDAAEVDVLRARLAEVGATWEGATFQVDTYFHHPARDLAATDEAFRVRMAQGFELTYKGPRSSSEFKVREEHNVQVGQDPQPLLEALGFRPAARLSKRRQQWHLGGCEVALDHIDGLGWFVEIEAAASDPDPAGAIQAVRDVLSLDGHATTTDSYLGMALERGAAGVQRL